MQGAFSMRNIFLFSDQLLIQLFKFFIFNFDGYIDGAVAPYPTVLSFFNRRKKEQKAPPLKRRGGWRLDPQNLLRRILQASLVRSSLRASLFQIVSLMPVCNGLLLSETFSFFFF
jgi:hypothetical protein